MDDLDDVKSLLPADANVKDLKYEASDVVLYTESEDFFLNNSQTVKEIVSKIKKRVEVRPTQKLSHDPDTAKSRLKELLDDEAGLEEIIFQPSLGKVIIRAEKPGKVIGNNGDGLQEIREETLWSPQVERVPAIDSKVVDRARELTVEDPDFRKDFLHEVGEKIRLNKSVGDEWIRVSTLGSCRQVGRSCFLLQTEESNVLLDCGINPSAEPGSPENFPYLNAPELDLRDLDAVILSHAHMDHCLTPDTPITMADGSRKPIAEVEEGEKLKTYNWETDEVEEGKCLKKKEVEDEKYLDIETEYNRIDSSGDHRFFRYSGLEVEELEASELTEGDFIPRKQFDRDKSSLEMEEPQYEERVELPESAQKDLRKKRKQKGLTCKEASKEIGMGINFVQQLETNYDSVKIDALNKLVDTLEISFKEFVEKHEIEETEYPQFDRKFGQLLGYFYGDGHRDENRLRFTDKNRECLETYSNLLEELFNYQPNIREHCDSSKNAYQLEVNNVGIVNFLEKNFEGIYETGREGEIPNKVFYGSREVAEGFLRGLFDAEGSVNTKVDIAQAGKQNRDRIQSMLSSVGIKATTDTTRKVSVAGKESIARFSQKIGSSHPEKKEKLEKLKELEAVKTEKMPVRQEDLKQILDQAGMLGGVRGSPDYSELPTCLVDWYRRDSESAATRETIQELVEVLNERVKELNSLNTQEIGEIRKALSLTRKEVAVKTENASSHHLQVIEDQGYTSEVETEVKEAIDEQVQQKISQTKEKITKLERLLSMDVEWHQIKSIEEKDNEYGYLVDLKVSPNENFIAQDQIVHNCGFIPYLYKMGYDGPLYCTEPTRDLMIMLTLDYIGLAHGEGGDAPYDSTHIKKAVKRTITPEFGEVTDITPDMRLTLKNSGHIIGSSLCHIHVGEGLHNLLYTGDYNYDNTEMLRAADTNFQRVETMITESTYGGKDDEQTPREESNKKFLSKMKQTLNKGGKVIVPVFAVGRSQEILGLLADEMDRDYFDYPVFIDGMIKGANALHTAYPEFLSEKVQDKVHRDNSPFLKENIETVGSYNERQEVFDEGPCIILTTSGSITGGPVMSYLKEFADDSDNSLIFVGYQFARSLGRTIQNGADQVEIDGEEVDINLDTSSVSGFSAHSDRQQIINYCKNLRSTPNRILCNHGEESTCFSLASTLHKVLHVDTSAPQNMEALRLN